MIVPPFTPPPRQRGVKAGILVNLAFSLIKVTTRRGGEPLFQLNKSQIGFMESGVSIRVASHDTQNRPVQGHAGGCRVTGDGGRVTLFLSRAKYPLLLDAVRRSGVVAVSFIEPSTNKSIQVKGESAELTEPETGDLERIAAYLDLFTADLERINVRAAFGRAVLAIAPADLAAVTFTPAIAFIQTPGPKAGKRIEA